MFDFAFAVWVFTHLVPGTARNYLNQISCVLKPQGMALVTFLILDRPQEILSAIAREELKDLLLCLGATNKWHNYDGYSVISPKKPEAVIAYQKKTVIEMIKQSGLEVEGIYYGAWNASEDPLSFQDIMIVRKS